MMERDDIRIHEQNVVPDTRDSYTLSGLIRLIALVTIVVILVLFCTCYDIYTRTKRRRHIVRRVSKITPLIDEVDGIKYTVDRRPSTLRSMDIYFKTSEKLKAKQSKSVSENKRKELLNDKMTSKAGPSKVQHTTININKLDSGKQKNKVSK